MKKEVSKVTKKREKDNKLMMEILKELTREEMKATVFAEDEGGLSKLFEKYAKRYKIELPSFLRLPPDEQYPIVKMDRATEQDLLPLLLNKSIFTNYFSLPTKEEIIEQERKRLNKEDLDFEEKRAALTRAKEYRQDGYVTRDYGNYVIGFSCQLYLGYIKAHEEKLEDAQNEPHLYPEVVQEIQQGLENIRLYRMAHRLAHIILAQVYIQKRLKSLVISKGDIVRFLGCSPNEKQIYQHIERALKSLLFCNYRIWGYNFTPGYKKRTDRPSSKGIGWFIYNLKINPTNYILDVNDVYVGCVRQLLLKDKAPKKERKRLFERGYFDWISRIYPLTKDMPISVELLSLFFISETGNRKLNKPGTKVITHRVERLAKEAHITHSRASRRYNDTLSALGQIEIIEKIEPPLSELKQLRPSKGLKTILHVHMKGSAKELDKLIERRIKAKSNP